MLQVRVIPCLQLIGESLVKTVRFDKHGYIGDPVNTVRIFNELEVDELVFLDIRASLQRRTPDFDLLRQITDECFMPLAYGGGVNDLETVRRLFKLGFEKIVFNTATFENPALVSEVASLYGSQAVVAAVDVRKTLFGKYETCKRSGTQKAGKPLAQWIPELERMGAGEILLTSIDREGTWKGFDTELVRTVSRSTTLPVIAQGGAGSVADIEAVVKQGEASAVALGSMVVYQQKDMGVLVNFPDRKLLERVLL